MAADDPRLARYLSGEAVEQATADAWSRVAVEGLQPGWARTDGRVLRSLLPRGLRRPYG